VGFGPTIEQMGGLVALQGYEDGEPHKSGISYGDPTAGTTAAGVVALALLHRETTGRGSHAVVTQRDNIISMVGEFMVAESAGLPYPVRAGSRSPDAAPHGVYRTRDDQPGRPHADVTGRRVGEFSDTWLALSVDSDEAWSRLRAVLGDSRLQDPRFETLAGRQAACPEIDSVIAEWAAARDPLEAATMLQAAGVDAHPVMSPLMLLRDEHLAARGYYQAVRHPEVGEHRTMRPVWRLRERPLPPPRPAPCFGQHNREVLRDAGYSDAEIEALERAGVLADVPVA
jgi:crotonobetainyl-CoA:carnitine CoA-transferase CaiB-like acyl-CoA transferase